MNFDKMDDGMKPNKIHFASCSSCGAQGPFANSKRHAVQTWNSRTPPGKNEIWLKKFFPKT